MDPEVLKIITGYFKPPTKVASFYAALKPFIYTVKAGSFCYRYEAIRNKEEIKWYSFYRTATKEESLEMSKQMWGSRCSDENPCKMLIMKFKYDINLLAIPYKTIYGIPKSTEDENLLQILLNLSQGEPECIRDSLHHLIGQETEKGSCSLRPDWDLMKFLCKIHLNGMIRVVDQDEDEEIVPYINQNVNINQADEIALCDSNCLENIHESLYP